MTGNYNNLHKLLKKQRLVLASGSPRRVYLLNDIGIKFRQVIPDIHEDNNIHRDPFQLATILAIEKARAIIDILELDEIVLGCDTIVILDGKIMGKPCSKEEARIMLSRLSGNTHTVCSGVAFYDAYGNNVSGYEKTDVVFKKVSPEAIKEYVETGEPLDKAGAYGIQDRGVFLVDRVIGNIDNVIGLPRFLVDELACKLAIKKGLNGF